MLKYTHHSDVSPWHILGFGIVFFAIGAVIVMFITRASGLTMVFGFAPLFTLLPLTVCLFLIDFILLSGKFRIRMILVSLTIVFTQLLAVMLQGPLLGTWFGHLYQFFSLGFFVFQICIIAGFIFAWMVYGRTKIISFTLICGALSIPFGILVNILDTIAQKQTQLENYANADFLWNLISPIQFFAMGLGITVSLTYLKIRALKKR